ncbi:MAG TPA: hypothetical protein VIF14_13575 [Alphaproteobacteria bacterium]
MQQEIHGKEIERAIDNFQAKVAGLVAQGAAAPGRRDAAKKVLAEALALARAEGVGLDAMKQLLLEEYGKPLPKADERAGTLVFELFAWAATAKVSLGKIGRWQAARIFGEAQSVV